MGQLAKNSKRDVVVLSLFLPPPAAGVLLWVESTAPCLLYLLSHATLDGFDLNPSCNYSLPAFVYLRKNIVLRRRSDSCVSVESQMMLSVSLLPVQSASVHVVLWLVGIRMPPHIKGRWCCLAPEKFKRLREQEQCGKKECSEWWKILTQRQSYTEKKNKLEHNEKKNEWKLQPHNQLPPPSSSLLQFMWPSQATP